LQRNQSVFEMVEDILARQAKSLADKTGQPLERALDLVTDAGQQLRELANGEYRCEKAQHWQTSMCWDRAEERSKHLFAPEALSPFVVERPYSWVEGYMEWMEGKAARTPYHALLDEELASLQG
jgi:hypothetical protein